MGNNSHPLYKGINIIGRESDDDDRNRERLLDWRAKHGGGMPVSAILLRFGSISSKHAIICESETLRHDSFLLPGHVVGPASDRGHLVVADMEASHHCFLEDLKSRNKVGLSVNGQLV